MSDHFTLRFQTGMTDRLQQRAQRAGTAPRTLAQRYVEEGMRHDDHPLIHFIDGPSGRRAALIGTGLDVWEAIATVRDNDNDLHEAADYLDISRGLVEAAVSYYGDYREEIDAEIALNDQEWQRGYRAFEAGQQALESLKALLDEQLSSQLAVELRARGLDVEAVSERAAMRGSRDEQVLEAASSEGRAVVTNNIKDFRPIAAARLAECKGHGGLILLPSTRSRSRSEVQALADGIEGIMRSNPGGLTDSERWVAPLT